MNKQKKTLNPYLLVILSFVVFIFIGALLLFMPFTRNNGRFAPNFIDTLFLATSATCVTGLNSFKQGIADEFNIGGQIVIMALIQIGGLGFIRSSALSWRIPGMGKPGGLLSVGSHRV